MTGEPKCPPLPILGWAEAGPQQAVTGAALQREDKAFQQKNKGASRAGVTGLGRREQGASERQGDNKPPPHAGPQPFHPASPDPRSTTAGPTVPFGVRRKKIWNQKGWRLFPRDPGGCGATEQPSPEVKDQADSEDDAQEKDEWQPGLYEGPNTDVLPIEQAEEAERHHIPVGAVVVAHQIQGQCHV